MDMMTDTLASGLDEELAQADLESQPEPRLLTPQEEIEHAIDRHRRTLDLLLIRVAETRAAEKAAVWEQEEERQRIEQQYRQDGRLHQQAGRFSAPGAGGAAGMTLNQELLTEIIPVLIKKLEAWSAEAGSVDHGDYSAWSLRRHLADDRIVEFFSTRYDAAFTQSAGAYSVRMAGIRSTSTIGWTVALQNWKRAAESKLHARSRSAHADGFNTPGSGPVPIEPREG